MWQHKWALWSGFLGATASSFVKMGVGGDSPLLNLVDTCVCEQPMAQEWLVDLDEVLLRGIHWVLGELMIKHRINFMPYWKVVRTTLEGVAVRFHLFEVDYCQLYIALPVRVLCIAAMLVTNVYMIASFLKGVQESGSVGGTSLSTAANFASSAIYGKLLWNEQMNARWCLGFSCVLMGVVILSSETEAASTTTTDKDKKNAKAAAATKISNTVKPAKSPYADIRSRVKDLERRCTNAATPPPPLEIHKKTRPHPTKSNGNIIQGKVAALRTSFTNNNNNNNKNSSPPSELPAMTPTSSSTKKLVAKITPSPEQQVCTRIPFKPKLVQPSSPPRREKGNLKSESNLKPYYNFDTLSVASPSNWINRNFVNECALCDGALFDKSTGDSKDPVADLSLKTCFHLFHSRCLKHAGKVYKNACPICEKPLAMWTASKQAAQFPGFWLGRVERFLKEMNGAPKDTVKGKDVCLPASRIREFFQGDDDLTNAQKKYIQDDPTGMDRGLQAALEWGGYIDCNRVPKGHVGFLKALRTRGIWKYDAKKDDIWFWEWGPIHPRQRCDQCQLIKRPLPVHCQGCQGSSEAAFYCSDLCAKRDKQRHKQTCDAWKAHGPRQ